MRSEVRPDSSYEQEQESDAESGCAASADGAVGVTNGMRDLNSNVSTYFNFSRIPGKLTPTHGYLLTLLVPHMHVALVRVLAGPKAADPSQVELTTRERAVLHWLVDGKTNWEIAQIFGTSKNTVKNQVRGLLVKLRVNNRAQAVGKAITLKLL